MLIFIQNEKLNLISQQQKTTTFYPTKNTSQHYKSIKKTVDFTSSEAGIQVDSFRDVL